MSPIKASAEDRERGKRLEAWLAAIRPDLPKTKRGEDVFGVPRQTVRNWIHGADINNDAIVRILECGGGEVLAWILGADMLARSSKSQLKKAQRILDATIL